MDKRWTTVDTFHVCAGQTMDTTMDIISGGTHLYDGGHEGHIL